MALSDNKRLYDLATRHQVLIEGVKIQYSREFNFVLGELKDELDKILGRIKYPTLDGLTKAELNRLIVALRASQSKIYSRYTDQLLDELREFTAVDMTVNQIVYSTAHKEEDSDEIANDAEPMSEEDAVSYIEKQDKENHYAALFGIGSAVASAKLWSSVVNAPIPANGIYLVPFVKGFAVSAQASVENLIRKAYANGLTLQETIASITGEDAVQGTSSQLQRISVQGNAVISTAVQHVAQLAQGAVSSALFARYAWHSVMDGRTTMVCMERNGEVYRYGAGPFPPAHINCRSHIAPIVGNQAAFDAESFYTWVARQPQAVQDSILSEEGGNALRTGKLKAKDLTKFEASKPLTLAQFRRAIKLILTR